ncbi:transporter substrate-binding domain-containing protein [Bdellovibrio sp.]|uniref:substrate-binding periplasmic protein n=1 Tax=Bdellovibrio sp. TaxID=28201 RepID=UPI0032219468
MSVIKGAVLALTLQIFSLSALAAERWVVTTLEWPPFTCSRCPENGAAAKALKDTLKTVGVSVEFVFYPWTQAIKRGERPEVVGFFPVWPETFRPGFSPSHLLFRSPLGIIQQRSKPLVWSKLSDLKGKKIGITEGYGNTVEFNRLVKEKILKVEAVKSDDTNLRKVALGQLDGALMDINNARYLMHVTHPKLAGRVSVSPRIVQDKDHFFAFNIHNKAKVDKLNKALANVNYQRIVDDYLLKYMRRLD